MDRECTPVSANKAEEEGLSSSQSDQKDSEAKAEHNLNRELEDQSLADDDKVESVCSPHSPNSENVVMDITAKSESPVLSPGSSQSPVLAESTQLSVNELSDTDEQQSLRHKKDTSDNQFECFSSKQMQNKLPKESSVEPELKPCCLDLNPEEQLEKVSNEDSSRAKLASMAENLVEKWERMKEVFRIPKRAPKVSTAILLCVVRTCTDKLCCVCTVSGYVDKVAFARYVHRILS